MGVKGKILYRQLYSLERNLLKEWKENNCEESALSHGKTAKERDVGTKSGGLQKANQDNAPNPHEKQVATESFKWGKDDTCTYYKDHSDCVENGWGITSLEQLIMWSNGR